MTPLLQVGDVITLDNVPEFAGYWRVAEVRADGYVRLRPDGNTPADAFNDAVGEFWIVPPDPAGEG